MAHSGPQIYNQIVRQNRRFTLPKCSGKLQTPRKFRGTGGVAKNCDFWKKTCFAPETFWRVLFLLSIYLSISIYLSLSVLAFLHSFCLRTALESFYHGSEVLPWINFLSERNKTIIE